VRVASANSAPWPRAALTVPSGAIGTTTVGDAGVERIARSLAESLEGALGSRRKYSCRRGSGGTGARTAS
jgi:hypothetical protein